ncbi:Pullulanase 1, chloroplastic [Capsicum chinense]|nr:Pullulanase 1, chloroplastic [Capsicum chinense]
MYANLLSSTPFSTIIAPSDFTRSLPLTHSARLQLSSFTRYPSGFKLATYRPLNLRFSSTMALQNQCENSSCSQLQDSLFYSRAFWVTKSIIAWNVGGGEDECYLYASRKAALCVDDDGIQGHDVKIKLERTNYGLPQQVIEKFPHIRDYAAFEVPKTLDFQSLVKCQLAVGIFNSDGKCASATGLQLPGILDELFSYTGPLGAIFATEAVSLYLWAPTAQAVQALIYKSPSEVDPVEIVQLKELDGVWSAKGPRHWEGCYYVYEVSVYHPSTLRIEKCVSNDPYARGLSADGKQTLLVNLASDDVKPEGWDNLQHEKSKLLSFSDVSIYELHVRDFSANDPTVPHEFQGGYLAFTLQDSAGVQHLKKLSSAGVTHVHLLPTFQFAGVEDEKDKWKHIDIQILNSFPPDSEEQQALITSIQDEDGYNWG